MDLARLDKYNIVSVLSRKELFLGGKIFKRLLTLVLFLWACSPVITSVEWDLSQYVLSMEEFPQQSDSFFISSIIEQDHQELISTAQINIQESHIEDNHLDWVHARYAHRDTVSLFNSGILIYIDRFASKEGAEKYFSEAKFEDFSLEGYAYREITLGADQEAKQIEIFNLMKNPNQIIHAISFQHANVTVLVFGHGDIEFISAEFIEEIAASVPEKIVKN